MVRGTSPGVRRADSSTNQLPSAKPSLTSAAARSASRVLPTPPAPRSVTRRWASIAAAMTGSSRRRPMNRVTWPGRLSRRCPSPSAVTMPLVIHPARDDAGPWRALGGFWASYPRIGRRSPSPGQPAGDPQYLISVRTRLEVVGVDDGPGEAARVFLGDVVADVEDPVVV